MARINYLRVLLGGLLSGVIINLIDWIVNGVVLKDEWAAAMKALNKPEFGGGEIAIFIFLGFLLGIFGVWLYAAIRPRFGIGPRTAVTAALAVWVVGSLMPSVFPVMMHLFRYRLMAIGAGIALVELVIGTVAGAWLYKEEAAAQA